jgi:hypothetical protein
MPPKKAKLEAKMTVPDERTKAVIYTREFLQELLYKNLTPTVPPAIREKAKWLLRHFPSDCDLDFARQGAPQWWGPPPPR